MTHDLRRWMDACTTLTTLCEARSRVPRMLYHATPADRLPSIMQHGLGAASRKSFDISGNNIVYLTDDPDTAASYAKDAMLLATGNRSGPFGRGPGKPMAGIAILQVDRAKLTRSLFRQDRNHQKQVYGGRSFEYHGVVPPEALSVYY